MPPVAGYSAAFATHLAFKFLHLRIGSPGNTGRLIVNQENKLSCPYCNGTNFQTGVLKQTGRGDPVEFAADKVDSPLPGWLEAVFKTAGVGGAPTRARLCDQCGHLSLFVERI